MAERTIVKNFNNFRGKDSRSSDLVRDFDYAIEFQNARIVKKDSCVTRQGYKYRSPNNAYNGLYTYVWTDLTTGAKTEELISLSENLYRKVNTTLVITYAGVNSRCLVSIRLDTTTSTFKCIITEGTTVKLNYDLGTGLEAMPVTLADLKVQIDAITNFSATISGVTSTPAAFLPITINGDLASSPKTQTLTIYEWEQRNTLVNSIFGAYHSNRGIDSWEMASCVNMNNVLYIATGYEYLHKYDGQNVYRAGLPEAETDATLTLSSTGFTDTNVKYIYLYKQVDNRGNTTLGVESDPSSATSPSNQKVNVTVANIVAGDGFNTGCAIVDGVQAGVTTITVDVGHTFKVGDTAYLYDGVTSDYTERVITAISGTTISILGDAVNVADNAVISNNLRIAIYRSTAGGSLYYKVAEIPNNSFTTTQIYVDSIAIASLGTQYVPPTKLRDILSVKPKYLCTHQGLLIASGAPTAANAWFWSNDDSPEGFDAEINFEQVKATAGGGIKGLASDQEHLILGTENSLLVVTGDIGSGNARQENLARGRTGIACHNSIVEIDGRVIFLGTGGFWSVENGFNLSELGAPINPDLDSTGLSSIEMLRPQRSVAVYFPETQEYVCFVPAESGTGTNKFVNSSSKTFIFDIFHQAWGDWRGINMGGGVTVYNNNLFYQAKREDSVAGVAGTLAERSILNELDDYADHAEPIEFKLGTQWIDGGEPSVFKVFLWLKAYNLLRETLSNTFQLSISLERDFKRGISWANFQLDFGSSSSSSGWGLFPWGLGPWGTPQNKTRKMKLKSGKLESLRYVMTNQNLHQRVALSAWETVVTSPYTVELKE